MGKNKKMVILGRFTEALAERVCTKRQMKCVKIKQALDMVPIGVWDSVELDGNDLRISGHLNRLAEQDVFLPQVETDPKMERIKIKRTFKSR